MKGPKSHNLLLALLLMLCTLPVAAHGPADYADLYEELSKSVVDIHDAESDVLLGSGVIISPDGWILTNAHVVHDYEIDETSVPLVSFQNKSQIEAEIIGYDGYSDIALLKIDVEEAVPAAKIGNSDKLRTGNAVLAIGHPNFYYYSLSTGVISSTDRLEGGPNEIPAACSVPWIQTDAAINGGNSGGPLFNDKGEVVGIISWSYAIGDDDSGVNFAVPINFAMEIQQDLRDSGLIAWGIMGAYLDHDIVTVTDAMGYDVRGLVVNQVTKGSGAEDAGLRTGDVIIEYNGEEVDDLYFACVRAGTEILVKVIREGEEMDLLLTLSAIEDEGFLALLDYE